MAARCPECNSTDYYETVRVEHCRKCGYHVYYGDAHAEGTAQITTVNGVPRGISQEEYDKMRVDEGKR